MLGLTRPVARILVFSSVFETSQALDFAVLVDWFHVRESRLKGFDVLASLCVIVVPVPKRAYFTQH
jgi:2-succinyl-5-enolpyruvyl-6-hydroxy-3-cyclohexene-1-carboxylate synthase